MKKFWSLNSGKIHLVPEQILEFLNENGFYNYRDSCEGAPFLIKKEANILYCVSIDDLKRFMWDYVNSQEFEDANEKSLVLDQLFNYPFNKQKIAVLKILESLVFIEDTKEYSFVYFLNGPILITKEGPSRIEGRIPVHIWRSQIIKFCFEYFRYPQVPQGCFHDFLKNISRDRITGELNEGHFNSLRSLIGYLLVTYKDKSCNPAVILRDIPKNDNPEGSTGKGILYDALSKIRKTVIEDGKVQDPDTRFVFSRVTLSTRILAFDDAKKNFPFERLFSAITEDLVVEEKNINKFVIPFEKSPKILITSNYPINGGGQSHDRRRFEFILSDYYNNVRTPKSEFGKIFFSEWDNNDWLNFYYTMFDCMSYFIANGLVKQKLTEADYNYITDTTIEFRKFADSKFVVGGKYFIKDLHSELMTVYPGHIRIDQNKFTRWIKLFAQSSGYEVIKGHSGDDNYFQFAKLE